MWSAHNSATKIQSIIRMYLLRKTYLTTIQHPLLLTGEIRITKLPNLDAELFEKAWALQPQVQSSVYHADRGSHPAHRKYMSYGKTPAMAPDAKTYMFSASNTVSPSPIPDLFQEIMNHLNREGGQYNQLVVNWYLDGTEYCPFHIDCLTGMRPKSNVAIVTLVDHCVEGQRTLVFKPTSRVSSTRLSIPTTHGQCVVFGGSALTHWRHGIPKTSHNVPRRISLSFRSYEK